MKQAGNLIEKYGWRSPEEWKVFEDNCRESTKKMIRENKERWQKAKGTIKSQSSFNANYFTADNKWLD